MQQTSFKRIAWFTGKSDSAALSRSAYLTQHIVPGLIQRGIEVELFSDTVKDFFIDPDHSLPVRHYLTAQKRHQENPYDLFFHQVEEGKQSHFLRTCVGLYPGVVYFHDLYLSDLGPDPLTNSPWEWVKSALFAEGHIESKQLAWPDRLKEFPRAGAFPERETGLAIATMSPSVRFNDDISRSIHGKDKHHFFCPYPLSDKILTLPDSVQKQKGPFCIALYGSAHIEDRIHKLFLAVTQIPSAIKINWMVPNAQKDVALQRVHEFNIRCELFHDISPEAWYALVCQSDAAVQLRFSAFGSLSPYLDAALASTRPVLVTDFGDSDYYPNGIVTKIPMGSFEAGSIAHWIRHLAGKSVVPNQSARLFVRENNNTLQALDNFIQAFNVVHQDCSDVFKRWRHIQDDAHNQFTEELFIDEYRELGWS